MNWLMTIIFLICIISVYRICGEFLLKKLAYENHSDAKAIITGFIFMVCIQWIIAFPCQIFHLSWNLYYYTLLFVYMIVIALVIFANKGSFTFDQSSIKRHFKNHWFLYTLVVCFSLFSMANQLPYFEMNYDDSYYLGGIVQNVNAQNLASVNYFNGAPETLTFARLINTFEIGYGFFGTLFRIDLYFFARGSMVIHNYFIVFMASYMLAEKFIKNRSYTQYSLAVYLLLLIPAGFLEIRSLVRMYDGWQFNTAVWYGSSIVRIASLPIMLVFAHDFFKNKSVKKLVLPFLVCVAMTSFSSIFISYFALFLITIGTVYLVVKVAKAVGKKRKLYVVFILGCMWVFLLCIFPLYSFIKPSALEMMDITQTQYTYIRDVLVGNNILLWAMIIYLFFAFVIIKAKAYRSAVMFVFISIGLFVCKAFDHMVLLTTIQEYFAALRYFTSVYLLMMLLVGISLTFIVKRMLEKRTIMYLAMVLTCFFVTYNFDHLDAYAKMPFRGSGLSKQGFDFDRVFQNNSMMPTVYNDLSDFMKTLPNDSYRIAAPYQGSYHNTTIDLYTGLNTISTGVEVCTTDRVSCDDIKPEEKITIVRALIGEIPVENMDSILDKYDISLVLTMNESVKSNLVENGYKDLFVAETQQNELYYLLMR